MLYAIKFLREIGLKSPIVPEPKCEDPLPILESQRILLNQFNKSIVSLNMYQLLYKFIYKFSVIIRYAIFKAKRQL